MRDLPPATPDRDAAAGFGDLRVDDAPVRYVNFCRVTGTPEEVVLDMGLQTPDGAAEHVWHAPQRVAMDFYTAKRLIQVLQQTLAQHEATFGTIVVDVEKRVLPGR